MPAHALSDATPVFVDPRGRRRRWAVVAAWIGSAIAATYLALVVSALLGGPTINAPFFPSPVGASAELPLPAPSPQDLTAGTPDPVVPDDSQAAVDMTSQPASTEPAVVTDPAVTPVTPDVPDAPGNSGSAPGQDVSATSPGADNRAAPDPHSTGRPQP